MVVVTEDVSLVGVNEWRGEDGVIGNSPKASEDKGHILMPIYTKEKKIELEKLNKKLTVIQIAELLPG